MIQVLAARRSFMDEEKRGKAISPRQCCSVAAKTVYLEETDRRLLQAVGQQDTPETRLRVPMSDLEMLMTKMHNDQVPEKAEVRAIFMLADIDSPRNVLTLSELEAAMRYWRMLIPERERIKHAFQETYFGTSDTERYDGMKMLLKRLNSSILQGEVEDIMSTIMVHTEGDIDKESALTAVIMEVLVRLLNRQYEAELARNKDIAEKGEVQFNTQEYLNNSNGSAINVNNNNNNNNTSNFQSKRTSFEMDEDEAPVKSSGGCCLIS
jgi:hypothetical protein